MTSFMGKRNRLPITLESRKNYVCKFGLRLALRSGKTANANVVGLNSHEEAIQWAEAFSAMSEVAGITIVKQYRTGLGRRWVVELAEFDRDAYLERCRRRVVELAEFDYHADDARSAM